MAPVEQKLNIFGTIYSFNLILLKVVITHQYIIAGLQAVNADRSLISVQFSNNVAAVTTHPPKIGHLSCQAETACIRHWLQLPWTPKPLITGPDWMEPDKGEYIVYSLCTKHCESVICACVSSNLGYTKLHHRQGQAEYMMLVYCCMFCWKLHSWRCIILSHL